MSEKTKLIDAANKLRVEAELDEQEAQRLDACGYTLQAKMWRESAGATLAQARRLEDQAEQMSS